jgi:uncharacterized iron-regulated protein
LNSLFRLMSLLIGLTTAAVPVGATAGLAQCEASTAQWLDPGDGMPIAPQSLFEELASAPVVLLGEAHTDADHHRWQVNVLAALHSRQPNLVIGLEMLPREVQPVLDAWSRGALDEAAFLEQARWRELWGYDAALYMPILHFARMHRLPMVALNIDRQLVSKVGAAGWDSLEPDERLGLTDPAPASADYRRALGELYRYKLGAGLHGHSGEQEHEMPSLEEVLEMENFNHFVDAQQTWDRAMAEALANAHELDDEALIVGIVGRGHLEYGYGIPSQLADLGIDDARVLLPVDLDQCDTLEAGLADAVFMLETRQAPEPAPRPRLGVMIENADLGVIVMQVIDDSVAESSGLREGDVVLRAAGFDTESVDTLIEVIQRQARGTWLPLDIMRDGREIQVIAKFPQRFE